MKFCVITHVEHIEVNHQFYGYAPYINEMNIWFNYVDEVELVAPKAQHSQLNPIYINYQKSTIVFNELQAFNLKSIKAIAKTIFSLPKNFRIIYKACKKSDHIHLRCPGNIGLLGCLVQIFFPSKPKTAKYAGNWDPKSKQPWSYKIQKWILNNTFLTKNMKVLVYGEWQGMSSNIKPFFTATYSNSQRKYIEPRKLNATIQFMFVGTLSEGKRPLYAVQLLHLLKKQGYDVCLTIFGDGIEKNALENYIFQNNLQDTIFLKGNQAKDVVEKAYKESHFLLLASKSEGWPKVVAEAMFWGCLPLTTNVSCVNYMIGNGTRGKLLSLDQASDVQLITSLMTNESDYFDMCENAINWSQQFTTDYFEEEIKKMILYNESSSVN
ncbi:Glycosyl transferase, group 1 family protein [Flavobacterium indicum GPTSA100-9 = DSM 17447]|uniref:Glycosyl transferase, group 1 family protein n=1 Tax=Flavobacterium indicum (strain DSM 17447 / CIP 109464 / GPTSA100-9) TaxID=1094466 RepID=H8XT87_FLAIG|nr:glycosyltransferase [Flavobacterium indicum]CCG52684.1 Glycosyl transferase, group 1 family protein [Flavobacterium indicum GPTSA100-9 = DSM 17447]